MKACHWMSSRAISSPVRALYIAVSLQTQHYPFINFQMTSTFPVFTYKQTCKFKWTGWIWGYGKICKSQSACSGVVMTSSNSVEQNLVKACIDSALCWYKSLHHLDTSWFARQWNSHKYFPLSHLLVSHWSQSVRQLQTCTYEHSKYALTKPLPPSMHVKIKIPIRMRRTKKRLVG